MYCSHFRTSEHAVLEAARVIEDVHIEVDDKDLC